MRGTVAIRKINTRTLIKVEIKTDNYTLYFQKQTKNRLMIIK